MERSSEFVANGIKVVCSSRNTPRLQKLQKLSLYDNMLTNVKVCLDRGEVVFCACLRFDAILLTHPNVKDMFWDRYIRRMIVTHKCTIGRYSRRYDPGHELLKRSGPASVARSAKRVLQAAGAHAPRRAARGKKKTAIHA